MTNSNASWGNPVLSSSSSVNPTLSKNSNNALLKHVNLVVTSPLGGIHSSLKSSQPSSGSIDGGGNEELTHDLDTIKMLLAQRRSQQIAALMAKRNNSSSDGASNEQVQFQPQKPKISRDTLLSLGIRKKPKCGKSILKTSNSDGDMGPRRSTMTNLREIEVELSSGETLRRNASVTFNEACKVKRIPSNDQIKSSTKKALWYQNEEFDTMREKNRKIIKMANKGELHSSKSGKTLNIRGLERYVGQNQEVSQARKVGAWDAVYWAQQDCDDDEYIASMIRSYSNKSLQEAQEKAREDAVDAMQIHQAADPTGNSLKAIRSYESLLKPEHQLKSRPRPPKRNRRSSGTSKEMKQHADELRQESSLVEAIAA